MFYVFLEHTVPEKIKKMKKFVEPIVGAAVYNPSGLNLSIKVMMALLFLLCWV